MRPRLHLLVEVGKLAALLEAVHQALAGVQQRCAAACRRIANTQCQTPSDMSVWHTFMWHAVEKPASTLSMPMPATGPAVVAQMMQHMLGTRQAHTFRCQQIVAPGTMPSSTAALVAFSASVTRSFFSLTSTSEAPPTCCIVPFQGSRSLLTLGHSIAGSNLHVLAAELRYGLAAWVVYTTTEERPGCAP